MNATCTPHRPMDSLDPKHAPRSLSNIRIEELPPLPFQCGRRPSRSQQCLSSAQTGPPHMDGHASSSTVGGPLQSNRGYVESPTWSAFTYSHRYGIESPRTPQVSFSPLHQKHYRRGSSQQEGRTRVLNLPWTDARGCIAAYTGEVNKLIQPHGLGHLQYQNGAVHISVWCNGMPAMPPPEEVSPRKETAVVKLPPKRKLELGDIALPAEIHDTSPQAVQDAAASLPVHSFAFVLRSDGLWTYAIVADRPVLEGHEASIRFVLNKGGSTKIVKQKYWGRYIRLVHSSNDGECENRMQGKKCEVNDRMRQEQGEEVVNKKIFERLDSFQRAMRRVSMDLSIRTKDH